MAEGTLLQHPTLRNEFLLVHLPAKTEKGADKHFRLSFDNNGQTVVSEGVLEEIAMAVALGFMPDALTPVGILANPIDLGLEPPTQERGYYQDRNDRQYETDATAWSQEVRDREHAKRVAKTMAARARQERELQL